MGWNLRIIDREKQREAGEPRQIGDAWYADYLINDPDYATFWNNRKSPEYVRDWEGKRPPIYIQLPAPDGGSVHWCIDEKASNSDSGWTVIGELPNLTITPSILMYGCYHGWVRDGELTDDIEGRTYDNR